MPVTPMGWASEGRGKSDKSFDVQELNTQARICTHLNLMRAEGRWSSASKRKRAGGGQEEGRRQETQMAQVCTDTPWACPVSHFYTCAHLRYAQACVC